MELSVSKVRASILPPSLPPRGLSRVVAAAYIGVSVGKFDEMVRDGRMPPPKRIDARKVWNRPDLDAAFEALPDESGATNEWDGVLA
ncbi:MAG: hypothetical protein QM698_11545 [Micropepsaceae bacterium]